MVFLRKKDAREYIDTHFVSLAAGISRRRLFEPPSHAAIADAFSLGACGELADFMASLAGDVAQEDCEELHRWVPC